MSEKLLRALIRENLSKLDEGFMDWLQRALGVRSAKIRKAQRQLESEVYPAIQEFYDSDPRSVSKILYFLDSALGHMDRLVRNIDIPQRKQHYQRRQRRE